MSSHPGCEQDSCSSPSTSLKASSNLQAWRSGMGNGRFTVDGGGGSKFGEFNISTQHSDGPLSQESKHSHSSNNTPSSSANYHLSPYQHLTMPFTHMANVPYQSEGPSSVPTNFGWSGHQAGLNFASVPSSPVFASKEPDIEHHQIAHSMGHGSPFTLNQQLQHPAQPPLALTDRHTYAQSTIGQLQRLQTDFACDEIAQNEVLHQSLLTLHKSENARPDSRMANRIFHKQPSAGSAASESRSKSKSVANSNIEEPWGSGSRSSSGASIQSTLGIDLSKGSTPSLLVPSRPSEDRPQTTKGISLNAMASENSMRVSNFAAMSMSTFPPLVDSSSGDRFSVASSSIVASPLGSSFPLSHLSGGSGTRFHPISTSNQITYPRTSRIGLKNVDMANADIGRIRSGWYPLRDPGTEASPQSSTGSSFSSCNSPSSPYSPSWMSMQNSRSDSRTPPVSARVPFGRDSWNKEQVSQARQAESGNNKVLTAELWKMCGLDHPEVTTGDALEQLVEKMREIGLNEDEIRMHLSGRWVADEQNHEEEDDDARSDFTANHCTEPSLPRENCKEGEKKLSKGALSVNSEHQDQISSDPAFSRSSSSFVGVADPSTEQRPRASENSVPFLREPSIERGRRTTNRNRTPSYLDAALQPDSDISIEMEWRAHSRSRSRPPETTNMDWRQASTSRSRCPARPLDSPQVPFINHDMGMNSFLNFPKYKPFKTSMHGTQESTASSSMNNSSSQDFFIPLADSDSDLSTTILESVDEHSDGYSDYGAKQLHQKGYERQLSLENLMDEMNQTSQIPFNSRESAKIGLSRLDLASASSELGEQAWMNSQHRTTPARLSDFDSGILGIPTTPSHSSLLGSIPGLDQDLAKVANAHAEYGSLPRLVRKTSFDETLAQHNMPSIFIRQSYLGPWNYREQGTSANVEVLDGVGVDVGSSGQGLPDRPSPRTVLGSDRRDHQLSPDDSNIHGAIGYEPGDASKLPFKSLSRAISPSLESFLSQLGSFSAGSKEAGVSQSGNSPTLLSLPPSNEAGTFSFLNSLAFGPAMASTGQEISNSSAAGSTGSLASNLIANLYTASGGVSAPAVHHPPSMSSLSDYDMLLQFTQPLEEQNNRDMNMSHRAVFNHVGSDSLSLLDPSYPISSRDRPETRASPSGLARTHVRLSEVQRLSTPESVPPITINPAQLHSVPFHYPAARSSSIHANNTTFDALLDPSTVCSLSSSSSSGSSDSSRASSLSSSTITGHQAPASRLQGTLHASETTASAPILSSSAVSRAMNPSSNSPLRSAGSASSTLASPTSVEQVTGSSINWNGSDTPATQQENHSFSGGRSSHASSIGQARKRSKQIPYSLTMNATSITTGTNFVNRLVDAGEGISEDQGRNYMKVTSCGIGMELSRSGSPEKSVGITGEDFGKPNSTVVSKDQKAGSSAEANQIMSSTASGTKCLNCQTTNTPLWRRDVDGKPLCNACGLFMSLHGKPRPATLNTGTIKRRNRTRQSEKNPNSGSKKKATKPKPDGLSIQLPSASSGDQMRW